MNPELEALVMALEAVLQAKTGDEAKQLEAVYQSRLDAVLAQRSGLSRERLIRAVDFAHANWLRARRRPPTLPPHSHPRHELTGICLFSVDHSRPRCWT